MGKLLAIVALVLVGFVAFGYLGAELPETNPIQGLAQGVRDVVSGIVDSIAGAGRGVAGSFGG